MKKLHKIITDGTLIGKYLSGTRSGDNSWPKVKKWLDEDSRNNEIYKELQNEEKLADALDELGLFNEEKAWSQFNSTRTYSSQKKYIQWLKIAAVFLFAIGLSSILIYQFSTKEQAETMAGLREIKPGEPKAYLELTNGSVVNLTELSNAQKSDLKKNTGFDVIGNTVIAGKSETSVKKEEKVQASYNILATPKGGEYKLVLEDSTEVWLNADSKLKFPLKFDSGVRQVELIGEAYFKVKKDELRPFIIRSNDMDIKVLGTEFNVSAYSDDPFVKTTLINGLVAISYKNRGVAGQQNLYPGDQASFNKKENTIHIKTVDVAKYTAWKDGFFVFENQTLSEISRILERWYNVQFVFQNENIQNMKFSGQFLRYDDISVVFEIFRKTGTKIQFVKEERIVEITQ